MKDIDAALAYYQSAALIKPSDAHYWTLLAEFCAVHQVSLREVGLPAARQALTLAPENAPALDAMGQVLVGLDDLASAERFFQQALQKDASLAAAHLHLAQVYLQVGQLPEAQVRLTQAYQLAGEQSNVRLVAQRLLERFFGAAP